MKPKRITVHCSATPPSQNITADDIRAMHIKKGWNDIGYHYVIRRDGAIEKGRKDNVQGAHVLGHNENNLGICLIGGVDELINPVNNFTPDQMHSLYYFTLKLCADYKIPFKEVCGHRDWFPDYNGDGIIDSRDWLKECPCFDVKVWFAALLTYNSVENKL